MIAYQLEILMSDDKPHPHAPSEAPAYHPSVQHVLQFFAYDHLPQRLKEVSQPFHRLAHGLASRLPPNPETTVALRKLLESKDAAVRAELISPTGG